MDEKVNKVGEMSSQIRSALFDVLRHLSLPTPHLAFAIAMSDNNTHHNTVISFTFSKWINYCTNELMNVLQMRILKGYI